MAIAKLRHEKCIREARIMEDVVVDNAEVFVPLFYTLHKIIFDHYPQ